MARKRITKPRIKKDKSEGKIAHKKTVVDGITFDSKMESRYYQYLKELKANGIVREFSLQPKFLLQDKFIVVNGETIFGSDKRFNSLKKKTKAETIRAINYIADFRVIYNDGREEIIDTKGRATADFEIKRKMLLCKYPTLVYKVLIEDKNDWVDYYQYNKDKRAKKRAKSKEDK